jgi:hypothetical protein
VLLLVGPPGEAHLMAAATRHRRSVSKAQPARTQFCSD